MVQNNCAAYINFEEPSRDNQSFCLDTLKKEFVFESKGNLIDVVLEVK